MEIKNKSEELQGKKERKKEDRQYSITRNALIDLIRIEGLGEKFLEMERQMPNEKFIMLMAMARGALSQQNLPM